MAIDVVHLCAASVENESGQVLATVLAICFLIYTGVTILLASLQLYSVSNKPDTSVVAATAHVIHGGLVPPAPPLQGMRL